MIRERNNFEPDFTGLVIFLIGVAVWGAVCFVCC